MDLQTGLTSGTADSIHNNPSILEGTSYILNKLSGDLVRVLSRSYSPTIFEYGITNWIIHFARFDFHVCMAKTS